jgi:hypothetical protein
MNQGNPNYKKLTTHLSNPSISIPRFTKDDNLKRFFPKQANNQQPGLNKVNSQREFGKDLTNLNGSTIGSNNNSFVADKKHVVTTKPLSFIRPAKKDDLKKKLKNDISLYNLRPRTMTSGNNSKNSSANTSFNNENVNYQNIPVKSLTIKSVQPEVNLSSLNNDRMQIDDNSNKMQVDSGENVEGLDNQNSFLSTLSSRYGNNSFSVFNKDPQKVSDYVDEIYSHLKATELTFWPNQGYMKSQRDINEKMRAILIDWVVDVHLKFKLLPETLFLTTIIIDRYLEKVEINRNKLQLVGVSALFIACKYEEIYPPELKDFVYITDKAYTKSDILSMESDILKVLEFNVTTPSQLRLLEAILEISMIKLDDAQTLFSRYLLELFLVDYKVIKYPPSLIAAATIYITMKVKKFNTVDGTKRFDMQKITGFTDEKIKECARDICITLDNADRSSLQAVKTKYSSSKYLEVAKFKKGNF